MKMFVFSEDKIPRKFDDYEFYKKNKEATFLRDKENIYKILRKQHELSRCLDALVPGDSIQIEGMFLKPNIPLVIKKSYSFNESDVDGADFTLRRLSGLTASVVDDYTGYFPDLRASEPEALGIDWNEHPRLYLSAVSGAELFYIIFGNFPLICALRKYQLKQIPEEKLLQIALILVDSVTLAEKYKLGKEDCDNQVPSEFKWDKLISTLPEHIKCHFM